MVIVAKYVQRFAKGLKFSIGCIYHCADVCTLQEKAAKALRSLNRLKDDMSCEQKRNFEPYSIKGKRPRFGGGPATKRGKPSTTP